MLLLNIVNILHFKKNFVYILKLKKDKNTHFVFVK